MNRNDKIKTIKKTLSSLRPFLQKDKGDIVFVDLSPDNILKVKYVENCKGCKFKGQTKYIIEKQIRKVFPQLNKMLEVEE